jgi:hypothetical protein
MTNELNLPWRIAKTNGLSLRGRDGRLIAVRLDSEDTAWRLIDTMNLFVDANPENVDKAIAAFRSTIKHASAFFDSIDWFRTREGDAKDEQEGDLE